MTKNDRQVRNPPLSSFVEKWLPWAALLVIFYYQAHRYFLNFDAGVIPTLDWKLGKYVCITALCVVAAIFLWRKILLLTKFDIFWIATFAMAALHGFIIRSADLIECAFWPLTAWFISKMCSSLSIKWLVKWSWIALFANVVMIAVQGIGLIYFGKYFSHANSNLWLSRFAGVTVEPLSAAMLGLFFVGFSFGLQGWAAGTVLALGVLFVILCQTWTCYLYLFILATFVCLRYMRRHPKWAFFIFIIALPVIFSWEFISGFNINLMGLYELKKPSAELHMTYWWPDVWRIWPSLTYDFNESWWVNGVENMGLTWTVAYHLVLFYLLFSVWKKYQSYRDTESGWVYLTTLIMGGYFLFGSLNLPYPAIYPANFLFFLFAMLCYFDRFTGQSKASNPAALNA